MTGDPDATSATPAVAYRDVSIRLGDTEIVHDLSLSVSDGGFLGVIGPNGSGKSTILRCLFRALSPSGGQVTVHGTDIVATSLRDNARQVAALTQSSAVTLDFTVAEVVATGRLPHIRLLRSPTAADREICERAMIDAGIGGFGRRRFAELSGGESQRVLIARAFAQKTRVLVLDEPTNHLDIRHQFAVLEAARARGITVIAALHDLNIAAQFCTELVVVSDGRIVRRGTPADVLTTDTITRFFGIGCHIVTHPRLRVPQIIFDEGTPR
ncbi:ABC transporter ATP-binding protein [Williamsia sp. Leaf354]|uniref:ABC transporter ATP-binding protein n=1 Tax=Williamsia sp. Leaf354 TaxID=1736349 RepID=UPI0006F56C93|nr:ABC transporter ATP-binding protein [Williamsia sp. Leaf354]KQR98441.1 ABC transporter ATP-binding protein [Williamsia sp. Leaf354]